MSRTPVKRKIIPAFSLLLLLSWAAYSASDQSDTEPPTGTSAAILNKYLEASQSHDESLRGASMEVEIDASIPNLKEQGRLHALRIISKVGQITYRELRFQGDGTIRTQVIARYLQAEQQGQGDQSLAITPANYKFKYKGQKATGQGKNVYVFQVSPHKKKVGLFKGEMWLDATTYLPVFEKGRFVKNPNIFFKKVDFERAFQIQNGLAIPEYTTSTIDARLIGKVELNISYSKFSQNAVETEAAEDQANTTPVAVSQ